MALNTLNVKNEEKVREAIEIVFSESGDTLEERLEEYNFKEDIDDEWVSESDYIELKKVLINHVLLIHGKSDYLDHFIDIFSGIGI